MAEEDMSNSAVNFTVDESFTNHTTAALEITMHIIGSCLFGFSFLIGVPTHSYVIWLIITGTGSGVASELFNLNLSVCGIVFSLNSLLKIWFLIPNLLVLSQFLLGLDITGRSLFQSLICVERYLAVAHPVTFLKFKPLRYRVICCSVVWIITLGSCLFCMLSFQLGFAYHAFVWFPSMQLILCFSIQLFCCVAVLRALKQSGPGERARERGEENHMKGRAFNLILITTVNTFISYVPFTITGMVSAVTEQYVQIFWLVTFICFTLTGFVPAILYLQRNGKLSCLSFCSM